MANAIKKTPDGNGIFEYKESVNTPSYPPATWEINPDVSGVSGVARIYWKYDGSNVVVEMSQGEKDAVDAALEAAAMVIPSDANLYTNEQSYNVDQSIIITLPESMPSTIVHVYDPSQQVLTGETLVSPAGTGWDPGNKGTGEANINNGNLGDLCYNNSAAGNTSGIIFGIDMGVATAITAMRRYDYNASYYDTAWEFIGTDDATGATYDVIFSATQTSANLQPNPYFRAFAEQTYRYFGYRCVTSFNATYTIISEMELMTGTLATVEKELVQGTDFSFNKLSPTEVEIKNLTGEMRTFKTVVVGK